MKARKLLYLLTGVLFGFVLSKAEVLSWFRIFEMFRLESFHMYGVLMSAIASAIVWVMLLKLFKAKTLKGEVVKVEGRQFSWGNVIGGLIFGVGWAMTGACPGPLYALIGGGYLAMIMVMVSALIGTYVYGVVRKHLPH